MSALRTLPEHIDELATRLRTGRLSLLGERSADRDERMISGRVDRVLTAMVGCLGLQASM